MKGELATSAALKRMASLPHVLVVDDDQEIRRLLNDYLVGQGFRVSVASDEAELLAILATRSVDLVVLDVLLPNRSGLEICRELRHTRPDLPVILLTALKEEIDRVIGLEIGADDYLAKPFNPRELAARIRAVLRRSMNQTTRPNIRVYRFSGHTAEPSCRRVLNPEGHEVPLTGAEFDLLVAFLDRPGRVLSRDQLLDLTRGRENDPMDRSIDVLMSRLRRKLGSPAIFKTVRNGGYQMVTPVEASGSDDDLIAR
jgi:two-component system OmpR family response regulator